MYLLRHPAAHNRMTYSTPKNTTSTISCEKNSRVTSLQKTTRFFLLISVCRDRAKIGVEGEYAVTNFKIMLDTPTGTHNNFISIKFSTYVRLQLQYSRPYWQVMRVVTKRLRIESRGFRYKVALYLIYLHI